MKRSNNSVATLKSDASDSFLRVEDHGYMTTKEDEWEAIDAILLQAIYYVCRNQIDVNLCVNSLSLLTSCINLQDHHCGRAVCLEFTTSPSWTRSFSPR